MHLDEITCFCHLSIENSDTLLEFVRLTLAISVEERLLITLPCVMLNVKVWDRCILQNQEGKSAVSIIVMCTCHVMWAKQQPITMSSTTRKLSNCKQFPCIENSVHGKQVRANPHVYLGSHFFNYKKSFSVVLLLVVIDVGAYGSARYCWKLHTQIELQILYNHVSLPSPRLFPCIVKSPSSGLYIDPKPVVPICTNTQKRILNQTEKGITFCEVHP